MATTTNTPMIVFFDDIGSLITPTANFTPPSGYPLSSLASSQLYDSSTRTPDLTSDAQLTWNFGAPVEANVFALIGSNADLSTSRRFRASDDAGFTVNVIQSGATLTAAFDTTLGSGRIPIYRQPWGRILLYIHPTSFTKQYIRWHQSDNTNPDGYQEWSIARLGLGWQPAKGASDIRVEPLLLGSSGSEKPLRGHQITLDQLTKAEAYELQDLYFTRLSIGRMLVIPEPLSPSTWLRDVIWCVLDKDRTYVREPIAGTSYSSKRYRVVMSFREVDY